MFDTLKLLLPALIPSWRFFDTISASPRVEFALLKNPDDVLFEWQEFRPRPLTLGFGSMMKRLVWNPQWNESLFLVSCAERLMNNPTPHSRDEILKRIKADLDRHDRGEVAGRYLQFRLVFVEREGMQLQRYVGYTSPLSPYSEQTIS